MLLSIHTFSLLTFFTIMSGFFFVNPEVPPNLSKARALKLSEGGGGDNKNLKCICFNQASQHEQILTCNFFFLYPNLHFHYSYKWE